MQLGGELKDITIEQLRKQEEMFGCGIFLLVSGILKLKEFKLLMENLTETV